MTVGVLLPTEGNPSIQQFTNDDDPTSLQDIVQGYFEIISLPSGLNLCVNEDGHALNMTFNPQASKIVGRIIIGPALLCGEIRKGKFTSLPASIIAQYVP